MSNANRVYEIIDKIFNGKDFSLLPNYYSEKVVCTDPGHGQRHTTYADLEGMFRLYEQAFPGYIYKIKDLIAYADKVAFTLKVTGIHSGKFLNIEPTNKSFEVLMMVIATFDANGKITEVTQVHDLPSLLSQLGINASDLSTEVVDSLPQH